MSSNNNRIIQFDALRVLAALAVVWLHTSAQRWGESYPSIEWHIRNFNDSLVRWCVPIFVILLHRQRTAEPVSDELRDIATGEHGGGGAVQAVWQEECVLSECGEGDRLHSA